MAKKYADIVLPFLETQYDEGNFPLTKIGLINPSVKFTPMLSPEGTSGTKGEYRIQRAKRLKKVKVPLTGAGGTDFVSKLNAMKRVDWETITTQTGDREYIGAPIDINEERDMNALVDLLTPTILNRAKNVFIDLEERALEKLQAVDTAPLVSTVKIDGTENEKLAQELFEKYMSVKLFNDEFKVGSDAVIIIHPLVAKLFSDIQGVVYQNGNNTFGERYKDSFVYKNTTFIPHNQMNVLTASTAGHIVGAIILDKEAFAMAKPGETMVDFDQTFIEERFIGSAFWDVTAVIDNKRIKVVEYPSTFAKSAKVNA